MTKVPTSKHRVDRKGRLIKVAVTVLALAAAAWVVNRDVTCASSCPPGVVVCDPVNAAP